jgi:hypothetical protein
MSIRLNTTLGACAGLVVASVAVSGPTAAQEPEASIVDLVGCAVFEGGETTVDAGLVDVWVASWGTGPRGALVHWLKSQTTTFTVQYEGGAPVTEDVSDQWTAPTRFEGEKGWGSDLFVSLGELEVGDTVLISFETTWSKATVDFFFGNHPEVSKEGELSASCLVTVVEG